MLVSTLRIPHSTLSRGHQAKEETLGKDSDQKMLAACPEALNQDATDPDHLEEKIRKERRCSEDWKMVYSTGWVIKKRICLYTPVVQGVSHITVAAETPKAIIRVPAREEWSQLLRGIMIEKHTHVREEGCQKARTVQEDIGNLNLKSKGQVWRMRTYPNHGYARRLIRSRLASAISIYQRGSVCPVMSKRMTEVKIRKIILRFFRQLPR
ncbi:hypothetical protein Tco_0341620 [Tanacetum coccineum]